jgi:signal transduction histidine kinase
MIDPRIYQDIADNARDALDCSGVQVYLFYPESQEIQAVAWSGLKLETSKRAIAAIRRVLPNFSPLEYRNSVLVNAFNRSVYLEGKTQVATFAESAANVAPPIALRLASFIARMRHTMTVPIKIDGAVVAGLSFQQAQPFTPQNIKTCEAFARQAALLLENSRLSSALTQQLAELAHSRRMLSENEERLRRDIAELLHTRVQTRLLVAWHRLSEYTTFPDDAARADLIAQVQAELEDIREHDVRQASHLLHPAVIQIGLVPALRSLATRVAGVLPLVIDADDAVLRLDSLTENKLPEALRLLAYRVVEEALSNILRHAKASNAIVTLRLLDSRLEVRVLDNGVGFDPTQIQAGIGLSSLQARVLAAGGSWHIDGSGGTLVVAALPLSSTT